MPLEGLKLLLNTVEPLIQCCKVAFCVGLTPLLDFDLLLGQRRLLSKALPITISCLRRLLSFSKRRVDSGYLLALPRKCRLDRCKRLCKLGQPLAI